MKSRNANPRSGAARLAKSFAARGEAPSRTVEEAKSLGGLVMTPPLSGGFTARGNLVRAEFGLGGERGLPV